MPRPKQIVLLIFAFLIIVTQIETVKILIFSSCFTGHTTPTVGIARSLLARGHNVEFLTSADCCDSNIYPYLQAKVKCTSRPITSKEGFTANNPIEALVEISETVAENGTLLAFEEVSNYLTQNPGYDVVMADYFLLGGTLAAKKHKIPVLTNYIGSSFFPLAEDTTENEAVLYFPESLMPQFVIDFLQFLGAYVWHKRTSEHISEMITKIDEKLNMPTNVKNVGLTFNLPHSYHYYFSTFVHFGPAEVFAVKKAHIAKKTNVHYVGYVPHDESFGILDSKVLDFVQKAKQPVVYMSLGTVFRMDLDQLQSFLRDLSNQKEYTVIWSATSFYFDTLKQMNLDRDNFMLVTNVAQLDLLSHEKVVAFMTHAGGNSLTEGIYTQTPMIVFPGLGDQPSNAKKLVGAGLALPLKELTYAEISLKLGKLLEPPVYLKFKAELGKSKDYMTSLGGYEKAADIVEQVQKGEIKVMENPPRLFNVGELLRKQFYMYVGIALFVLFSSVWGIYNFCCKKLMKAKKE
ncbi:putative UDP-glucosyltransferase YojK [Convolutriloba macropyga]|uniref:putative UDP-glucosyltransferase YojK n=1 Tax=Convolutriloba macropyga TaxID=536237 RepID=UPI003F522BF9